MPFKEDSVTDDVPAFLCSLEDGIEADIAVSLLESNNIPVMKKRRSAGEYLKIYMGVSFFTIDIYVPSKLLVKAKEILSGEPIVEDEEGDETEVSDEEFAKIDGMSIRKSVIIWIIILSIVTGLIGTILLNILDFSSSDIFPNSLKYHPLIINIDQTPQLTGGHDRITRFWHELTDEQLAAVFPTFGYFGTIRRTTAGYREDGKLRYVRLEIERPDEPNFRTIIRIRRNNDSWEEILYYLEEIRGFTASDVHGIPVVAIFIDHSFFGSGVYERDFDNRLELHEYRAFFELDGVLYHISLYDHPDTPYYNKWLEGIVNEIIIGSVYGGLKSNLSVLDNPEIPELRDEQITLEQAYADPDFGAYIPKNIPEGLTFESARRFINQTRNNLRVSFRRPNELGRTYWTISKPNNYLSAFVSLDEREKYDMSLYPPPWIHTVPSELWQYVQNPIFRAEDMSFDIVMARVYNSRNNPEDIHVRRFGVLIDGIIIDITPSRASPEEIWEMLEQVL